MSLLNQANEAVASGELEINMNETKSGGDFKPVLLPKGKAWVQLTSYIDLGIQPRKEMNGQKKTPCAQFILEFHVVGGTGVLPDKTKQKYVGADGFNPKLGTPFGSIDLSQNEKSNSYKIFLALQLGDTSITHFAQCLGKFYLLPIDITEPNADGKQYQRYNFKDLDPALDLDGDPLECTSVSEDKFRLFLWDKPTKEQWDSIYIEGTWKDKDGKEHSKNVLQEKILNAQNFVGSKLESLLSGVELPSLGTSSEPTDLGAVPDL